MVVENEEARIQEEARKNMDEAIRLETDRVDSEIENIINGTAVPYDEPGMDTAESTAMGRLPRDDAGPQTTQWAGIVD